MYYEILSYHCLSALKHLLLECSIINVYIILYFITFLYIEINIFLQDQLGELLTRLLILWFGRSALHYTWSCAASARFQLSRKLMSLGKCQIGLKCVAPETADSQFIWFMIDDLWMTTLSRPKTPKNTAKTALSNAFGPLSNGWQWEQTSYRIAFIQFWLG